MQACEFHENSCNMSSINKRTREREKNGLPSMKVRMLEKFLNKMGLKACKWSSLNASGIETPQSHPYWELGEFPFPIISPLG